MNIHYIEKTICSKWQQHDTNKGLFYYKNTYDIKYKAKEEPPSK